ncbi:metallophosphoesterase [Clostridium nigeriense]|uniref:metallophosphoesterase n=1 Tax=Clostridium nigeriense TaxID=1805470 RepID=UPI003D3456BB
MNGFNSILKISPLAFWPVFWALALCYTASFILNKYIKPSLTNFLYLIGAYWLGLLMYSALSFPILAIINLLITKAPFFSNNFYLYETILILLIFIFITILGSYNAKNSYIKYINVKTNKECLKEPLNIVMVSDLHLGNIIRNKRLKTMVKEINSLNPDIVIIAGDIIDSDIKPFLNHNMANEFSSLKSKYGVFATLGNHDIITKSENEIVKILKENSIIVLRDEVALVNDSFYIIGRDDITVNKYTNKSRASLEDLTKDLDKSKPLIVVDHNPKYLNESLDANIDLQLSGHTHKGQIAPGNIVTNKLFEVHYGHLKKNNLNVVVSSGYGTWGPPVRLGSKSEIVQINLQ